MPVFFNGQLLVTPTSASVVDDSAMTNRNISVGNALAIIGASTGGKPNTPLRFGSPSEAKEVLKSGDLLEAVVKAFDPSAQTGGPSVVTAIRVNPATQSTLTLKNSSAADVITLSSTDYGLRSAQIAVKIESGSSTGRKITTRQGSAYYVGDNIARNAFQVQYTGGQATGAMSITGTTLTLKAPLATTVATIDLNQYPNIQALVDRINVTAGFIATVLDGNANKPSLNGLDYVTDQDVRTTAYTARADLQAIVDWFNSNAEPLVNAARVAAAGTLPANTDYAYLSGGSDGTVTNTEWSNAFTALQSVDVQWAVPLSSNAAVHAMADSHVAFMSSRGKMERRSIVGSPLATSDTAALQLAKAINSDRTSLVHLGYWDYNSDGVLVLREPYLLAALLAGAFCGVNPGTALTNKTIKVSGLERDVRNPTDTDLLCAGGVLAVENTAQGYKVVQSISTWLANDNYNRVEQSTGVALDFVVRNVREALDVLRGEKGSPLLLSRAVSIAKSRLDELARAEPAGPGVIVGDAESPPYRNVTAKLEGDVVRVEFECSPAIPANYVLTTVHAVPYSGSATA